MKTLDELKNCFRLNICSVADDGGYGIVTLPKWQGSVVWSYDCGWDHVSVSPYKKQITPSWDDMCMIKDMFFDADEWVCEFHPPKAEYVNNMKNCLHIWKPNNKEMPTPPWWMVGIKEGKTAKDAVAEYEKEKTNEI